MLEKWRKSKCPVVLFSSDAREQSALANLPASLPGPSPSRVGVDPKHPSRGRLQGLGFKGLKGGGGGGRGGGAEGGASKAFKGKLKGDFQGLEEGGLQGLEGLEGGLQGLEGGFKGGA